MKLKVIKEGPAKGAIWEKGEDGKYRSDRFPELVLEEWHICSDLKNRYVVIINE